MGKECIEIVMHGATIYQDFEDFAFGQIQDEEVAFEIAKTLLNGELYQDNVDNPEFYCTYQAIDAIELEKQLKELEGEYGT